MTYRLLFVFLTSGLLRTELEWEKIKTDNAPAARLVHAMAYDNANKNVVLFGGRLFKGGRSSETWIWKGNSWEKLELNGPGEIDGHEMAFCKASKEILLFGGNSEAGILNESWIWNGTGWMQREVSGPSKRWAHKMISYRERVLLFGGKGELGFLNDTWEWDGKNWKQVSEEGPAPRYGPRMGIYEDKVILYGGRDHSGNWFRDTWEWDGKRWRQIETDEEHSPGMSAGHYLVSDGKNNLYLIGGILKGESFTDVWKWNGHSWKKYQTKIPFQLDFGASVYDSDQSKVIITGNARDDAEIEFWEADLD